MNLEMDKLCEGQTNRIAKDMMIHYLSWRFQHLSIEEMDRSSGRKSGRTQ